jgi:hypothetical protein
MMPGAIAACRDCGHFENSARAVEAAMPGLSTLSSAYAAVRSEDGVCGRHARYVAATSICAAFRAPRSRSRECGP